MQINFIFFSNFFFISKQSYEEVVHIIISLGKTLLFKRLVIVIINLSSLLCVAQTTVNFVIDLFF